MFSVLNLHVHIRTAYLNSSLHWVLSATFFVLLYSIAYFSWHNIIFIFSPYFKTRGQQTMAHGPYLALAYFCEESYIGTQPCSFIYILNLDIFILWWQTWVDVTESMTCKAEKCLLFGPLCKKFADLCYRHYEVSDCVSSAHHSSSSECPAGVWSTPKSCWKAFILISITVVLNLECHVNFIQTQQR